MPPKAHNKPVSVSLHEITLENFQACIDLKVADEQKNFVATNVFSLAQTKVYPAANPFAVYAEDLMVGFVMFGFYTEDKKYYLSRLMIDERFQGKGYGRATVLKVIEKMRDIEDCTEIYLSFVPENTGAERLYSSIGFEKTGEINEGEIVMRFDLAKSTDNEQPTTNN